MSVERDPCRGVPSETRRSRVTPRLSQENSSTTCFNPGWAFLRPPRSRRSRWRAAKRAQRVSATAAPGEVLPEQFPAGKCKLRRRTTIDERERLLARRPATECTRRRRPATGAHSGRRNRCSADDGQPVNRRRISERTNYPA